jgi:hypothetical protein
MNNQFLNDSIDMLPSLLTNKSLKLSGYHVESTPLLALCNEKGKKKCKQEG